MGLCRIGRVRRPSDGRARGWNKWYDNHKVTVVTKIKKGDILLWAPQKLL